MKENDIRPKDLMKLKEPALQHDIDFMKNRMNEFEVSNCPCCNSLHHNFWDEKNSFKYDQCNDCKTVFMNPRPGEILLGEFYRQSKNYEFWAKHIFPASDSIRKERIFKPRAEKVINFWKKYNGSLTGRFLEVGAAYGTFCEAIRDHGVFKEIIAVEPTPELAKKCRAKNLVTHEETIEELTIESNSVDLLACFEVIEHLANPIAFVEKVSNFLRPGGIFVCSCPNSRSLSMLEIKSYAREVDHEHLNYFNPDSLSLLVKKNGFEVLEVETPGLLDVDLMKNIYKEMEPTIRDERFGGFLKFIIQNSEQKSLETLQSFIREAGLSSHMWIVCKKL
ncbi:class I SAM-dependent methyltransferase [Peredibacter starrii]|uniref:Class I SAM-dependent methyltransferase n=1 Tax=Peredibacter starrii TaxID=28202 RepID=A0AAX4HRV4_9BACT|nr:class I SAM-dependent methyltransferase [Peredibacter starrii]WPU65838.1 class I SAM-dependent methyltransferase [Peredibacter starrii]